MFSLQSLANALSGLYNSLSGLRNRTSTPAVVLPSNSPSSSNRSSPFVPSVSPRLLTANPINITTTTRPPTFMEKITPKAEAQTQTGAPSGSYGFQSYTPFTVTSRDFGSSTSNQEKASSTYNPPPTSGGGAKEETPYIPPVGKDLTNTPLNSPVSSNLPPPPVGGSGFVSSVGGGGGGAPSTAVPRESVLPPPPTLPSDAIGRYEAMMRALLQQYGNTGKVPVPLGGAPSFGVGSAFGDILKQLQQRARV